MNCTPTCTRKMLKDFDNVHKLFNFNIKMKMNLFEREFNKIKPKNKRFDINELDVEGFCVRVHDRKKASDKEKIDALLELDATLYMNIGIDSLKSEKIETKKKSRTIYRTIRKINKAMGDSFLDHQDKQ